MSILRLFSHSFWDNTFFGNRIFFSSPQWPHRIAVVNMQLSYYIGQNYYVSLHTIDRTFTSVTLLGIRCWFRQINYFTRKSHPCPTTHKHFHLAKLRSVVWNCYVHRNYWDILLKTSVFFSIQKYTTVKNASMKQIQFQPKIKHWQFN